MKHICSTPNCEKVCSTKFKGKSTRALCNSCMKKLHRKSVEVCDKCGRRHNSYGNLSRSDTLCKECSGRKNNNTKNHEHSHINKSVSAKNNVPDQYHPSIIDAYRTSETKLRPTSNNPVDYFRQTTQQQYIDMNYNIGSPSMPSYNDEQKYNYKINECIQQQFELHQQMFDATCRNMARFTRNRTHECKSLLSPIDRTIRPPNRVSNARYMERYDYEQSYEYIYRTNENVRRNYQTQTRMFSSTYRNMEQLMLSSI